MEAPWTEVKIMMHALPSRYLNGSGVEAQLLCNITLAGQGKTLSPDAPPDPRS